MYGLLLWFSDPESGSQYSNNIQQRSITIITNDTNGKDENSTTSNNNSPAGVNMEDERWTEKTARYEGFVQIGRRQSVHSKEFCSDNSSSTEHYK